MLDTPASLSADEVYSPDEIARAARVSVGQVLARLNTRARRPTRLFIPQNEAVRLVRALWRRTDHQTDRSPLTLLTERKRRGGLSLVASGFMHVAALVMIVVVSSLGLLNVTDTEQSVQDPNPVHLVYLVSIGPGGGGGGGGLKIPAPPPKMQRKPPVRIPKRISSPVQPVRTPPPPRPVVAPPKPVVTPPPVFQPPPQPVDPPKPAPPPQVVQAPVVPAPADRVDAVGTLAESRTTSPSLGPGTGGGVGSGSGTGTGEGQGSGVGPGSGGGAGGGPFQPGTGIDPPVLLREVKPSYTDEARRRAIEGDVVLEIVVRRDGSVSNLRIARSLGAGLDQRAIEAVRQWRFAPARRAGSPVDVEVEVSVAFKMR